MNVRVSFGRRPLRHAGAPLRADRGFSLIELLCVVAIISILAGAAAMAVPGFRSTYARKEAIDDVMNTLERARVAALQGGEDVSVIFARPQNGAAGDDAMMVVGNPPLGSESTAKIYYTKWTRLPKGIRFLGNTETVTGAQDNLPTGISSTDLPPLAGTPDYSAVTHSTVTFNSTGQVTTPAAGNLTMALFEGTRTGSTSEQATGASAKATQGLSDSGQYEVIRIARYSGRARVDIGTLQNP